MFVFRDIGRINISPSSIRDEPLGQKSTHNTAVRRPPPALHIIIRSSGHLPRVVLATTQWPNNKQRCEIVLYTPRAHKKTPDGVIYIKTKSLAVAYRVLYYFYGGASASASSSSSFIARVRPSSTSDDVNVKVSARRQGGLCTSTRFV